MNHWKTSLAGIIAGLGIAWHAAEPYLNSGKPINWGEVVVAIALAVLGWHSADAQKKPVE